MDAAERLLRDLARWAAAERSDGAARSRTGERWFRQQAAEEATFVGLAVDVAEAGTTVTVGVTGGRAHRGTIPAVGADFLVVRPATGAPVLVRLAAVAWLRPAAGAPTGDASSRRAPARPAPLASVLAGLAGERARVSVALGGMPEPVTGELRACGEDVLTVLVPGTPPSRAYLRLDAITDVTLVG